MINKAGDQSLVRINNQKSIIEYIREKGPISKAGLAKKLKISKPTVATNVEDLIAKNILYIYGEGKSSGGRKPTLIDFNVKYKYILALNINIDYPMIAIFNLNGEIINKIRIELKEKISEVEFFNKLYDNINKIFKKENISKDDIDVISISTPGIIDENSGEISANPQFEHWGSINLKKELNKKFNQKIIMKNDVSMSALGEKHYGIGRKYNDLIYISSTLGVGAGLILNGELYEGFRKAAGEIGYFISNDSDVNFEDLYSIPNFISKIEKDLECNKQSLIYELSNEGQNKVNIEMIKKAIASNDEYIIDILSKVANAYGTIINNISILLDLEAVIIGGVLRCLGDEFIAIINKIIKENAPIDVAIYRSELKENSSLYGTYIVGNNYITENIIK